MSDNTDIRALAHAIHSLLHCLHTVSANVMRNGGGPRNPFVNRSPRGDRDQYLKFLTEISGHGALWYSLPRHQIHRNPSSWTRQYGQWSAEQRWKYHNVAQQDIRARDIVLPAESDVLAMIEATRRPEANRDRRSRNEQL